MNLATLELEAALRRIEALEQELDELRKEATTDRLTGLGNLRMLDQTKGGKWYVLADLNGFKAAQDSHPEGHAYGDRVLKEFAGFLVRSCRAGTEEDKVAIRRGGDEFLVCCGSLVGAEAVADRLREWRMDSVTVAVGIGETTEAADAAMYSAKRNDPLRATRIRRAA